MNVCMRRHDTSPPYGADSTGRSSPAVFCARLDRQRTAPVTSSGRGRVSLGRCRPWWRQLRRHRPVAGSSAWYRCGRRRPRPAHALAEGALSRRELGATLTRPIELTDRAPGATIGFPFELEARDTGTYWFDVPTTTLLTRIPLVVERGYRPGSRRGEPSAR